MSGKYIQIAIDGPGGAGKSSLAKGLAAELGKTIPFVYVDTGALYRAVGLYVLRQGRDTSSHEAVAGCLPDINITMEHKDGRQAVILNGEDVTGLIRTPEVSMAASDVSAVPQVREFLLSCQRGIANTVSVVMDGRDIGTVILPDADVKIFLTAGVAERAKRRWLELREKGDTKTLEEVRAELELRDKNDSSRAAAPLKPAPDSILYDNTVHDLAACIEWASGVAREKCGDKIAALEAEASLTEGKR
ncbi:MAG: (d)CMP kinase [Eubacteriales bacterium]|jgi:cytidylate kinase